MYGNGEKYVYYRVFIVTREVKKIKLWVNEELIKWILSKSCCKMWAGFLCL
jgi:hypothetical protein